MKKIVSTISILMLSFSFAFPQSETHLLTLEKSIEIAKIKSLSMLQLEQDLRIAEYNLKSATSRLKTLITMDLRLPEYVETVSLDPVTNSYYSVKQWNYSAGLDITQPLPTDGRIYVQSGASDRKSVV